MGEILSYEDWMRMRAGRHRGDVLILDRHDAALRARLAEVEAERDEALELVAAELIEGPQTESEALARRLAEVEQALQELAHWRIAQSHDAVQMRSLARAVLDKGEPTTSPDLPRERSDAERLAALNALREAEGNAPLLALPPESSWADAHSVTFDKGEPDG